MKPFPFMLAGLCAWSPIAARAGDAVKAAMTYQDRTTALDHILIVRHGDEEGLGSGPELRIYLTDHDLPLTAADAASTLTATAYAKYAKIDGVVIVADPAGENPHGVAYLLNAPGMAENVSESSSNSDAFSAFHVAAGRASGTATFDSGELKIDATFDAALAPTAITSDLKGKAAAGSAPAKALSACMAAFRSGESGPIAQTVTAQRAQALAAFRASAGEAAFRAAMRDQPDAATLARTLARLIVRGPNASAVLADKTVFEMVLEDGGWKCN